jgi:hypothetical protein
MDLPKLEPLEPTLYIHHQPMLSNTDQFIRMVNREPLILGDHQANRHSISCSETAEAEVHGSLHTNPWVGMSFDDVQHTPICLLNVSSEELSLPLAFGLDAYSPPPSVPLFRLLTNSVSLLAHLRMDKYDLPYGDAFDWSTRDGSEVERLDSPVLRIDWGNGVVTYSLVLDADLYRVNPCGLGMTPYWRTLMMY